MLCPNLLFPLIRGMALFPDHKAPLQWYSAPKPSLIPDHTTRQPWAALQLIKFRGDAGDGGFLKKRWIVLETDTFVPQGEDNASVISSRYHAINECRDMITAAFFTPSIHRSREAAFPRLDKATRTATSVMTIAATGVMGRRQDVSHSEKNYKRVDKRFWLKADGVVEPLKCF